MGGTTFKLKEVVTERPPKEDPWAKTCRVVGDSQGYKQNGKSIRTNCPSHNGDSHTLLITPGDKKVTFTCFKGCEYTDILDAFGLTKSDTYYEDGATCVPMTYRSKVKLPPRPEIDSDPAKYGKVVEQYDYYDRDGALSWSQVRLSPKRFLAKDANGFWGRGDITVSFYRLPQIIAAVANGDTIYICEGEKDVDRMVAEGYEATCNPNGALSWKHVLHDIDIFKGANVVVVVDRDAEGDKLAEEQRESLEGVAETLRFVKALSGKDAFDHFEAGFSVEQFVDAEDAKLADLLESANVIKWDDFWTEDHSTEEWLVYPLIPKGRGVALYAPAKAGKSTILLAGVAAAACGKSVYGAPAVAPIKVLYLDYEMSRSDLWERMEELGYSSKDDLSNLYYASLPELSDLDTKEGGDQVLALASLYGVDLVVIETFGRVTQGEENESKTVQNFFNHTARPLKRAGVAVIRTDHTGKDSTKGSRGSSAKSDDVDIVWELKSESKERNLTALKATHKRMKWVPEGLIIQGEEDEEGCMSYQGSWPDEFSPEVTGLAVELDALCAPIDIATNTARELLGMEGNVGRSRSLVRKALRFRRFNRTTLVTLREIDGKKVPAGERAKEAAYRVLRAAAEPLPKGDLVDRIMHEADCSKQPAIDALKRLGVVETQNPDDARGKLVELPETANRRPSLSERGFQQDSLGDVA